MTLMIRPSENMVRKGENAVNHHFPLFPKYFLPYPRVSVHLYPLKISCMQISLLGLSLKNLIRKGLTIYNAISTFKDPEKEALF